jgi:nucleotide-binding universal stress UspA family protein
MKVLLAVDSVTTLNILLDEMTVRSWPSGTEAQVVSIVEDGRISEETWRKEGYGVNAIRRELARRGEQISALAVERLREAGIPCRVVIMRGNPEFLISFAARKWPADLILVRAHNRKDFRNRLLGSVAKSVVESAPCSVEVIRPQDAADSQRGPRILLATDGSEGSLAASHAIAEMTWPDDTEIKVVSVVSALKYSLEEIGLSRGTHSEQAHRAVDDALQILASTQLKVSGEVITGKAARKIIEHAGHWKADLVVLGANQSRGIKGLLLGSTSAAVANQAHCSVRVIRGESVSHNGRSLSRRSNVSQRSEYKAYTISRKQTVHSVSTLP